MRNVLPFFLAAVLSYCYFISWWFTGDNLRSLWMWILLVFVLLFSVPQLLGNWVLYLLARKPAPPPPFDDHCSVDVYVTSCDEPYAMVEASLIAACAMRGGHRTWLLDDAGDPALSRLAEQLGAGYLTRDTRVDAKAGNINAALPRTSGDLIVVFDVDHVPDPSFLERSVGYFRDPAIGFVQVMLTFANSHVSWVAGAGTETSIDWYNPTSIGMDSACAVTMMGSNALIRRAALESIGGYQPGLAEDLATSITLHATGWQSKYVPEPLAPGLAPSDLLAWFTQQLKWARGVFEVLLTTFPQVFQRLNWGQRLSYAVRTTRYWIGPVVLAHLVVTILALFWPKSTLSTQFQQYLAHLLPLIVADITIRSVALRLVGHSAVTYGSPLRAAALVHGTWPIYCVAWIMALLRVSLAFRPTPKSASGVLRPSWMAPQIVTTSLLALGIGYWLVTSASLQTSLVALIALAQLLLQGLLLLQWVRSRSGEVSTMGLGRVLPTNPPSSDTDWRPSK